jgi:hypothetical protein
MNKPQFLSRGIDYLGDLGAKLKDLQGFATLAHELIQNADDAPGVTSMSFDIWADELFVENNGSFSDCQKMEMVECPWKSAPGKLHRCDFHRFRHVAGGDKRDQMGTTGAFGIGFISVYQITDKPELISNGRHWILHEDRSEQERIEVCPGCARCTGDGQPKTRFILPWCNDPASKLRSALRAEATSPETPTKLLAELEESLPAAMLFLKNLKCIELKQNGKPHRKFERVDEGTSLILTDGDSKRDRVWHLLRGEFEGEAQRLRQLHPGRIEEKRSAKVTLAIPQSELQAGLLCACLPSQHETGLPFHINADFFPTNDRKRIIFENDYQSAWNRAALKAAATTLAGAVGQLPKLLDHQAIWNLFARLQQVAEEAGKGHREKGLTEFWTALAPKLKDAPCIFTTQKQWKRPSEAFILSQKEEVPIVGILEELEVAIVHEDLRPHFNMLRSAIVGLQLFGLPNLIAALARSGLAGRTEKANWPKCLQPKGALETLWRETIIRDIQVLCPMNRGSLGIRELNVRLQNELNPERTDEPLVEKFGWQFRPRDKVIQTENDYDKEVFNGDIGQIVKIDQVGREVTIRFDQRDVGYDFGELDEISLAYAITIHKSQGSEFPAIVIPLAMQQYMLLQRNLVYTGITRGKRLVVLIGQRKALGIAVRNNRTENRFSGLLTRLIGPG